jgi:4-oxalocrotonate tautomerase family enzyme
MPLVTVSVHAGQLDDAQKARMISLVTDAVVAGEGYGAASRASTWVVIQEIPAGSFGVAGRQVRLADFLALVRERQAVPDASAG